MLFASAAAAIVFIIKKRGLQNSSRSIHVKPLQSLDKIIIEMVESDVDADTICSHYYYVYN